MRIVGGKHCSGDTDPWKSGAGERQQIIGIAAKRRIKLREGEHDFIAVRAA